MSTTTATPPAAAAATKGARDILLLVLHLRWKSVRRRRTAANFCPAVVPGREARKGERGSRMNDDVRVARAHPGKRYRSRSERSSLRRLPNSADFTAPIFLGVSLFSPPGWEEPIDGTFAWEKLFSTEGVHFFN